MSLIPVVLVTGFLGSGKTTLLRNLAHSRPELRLVFLINELADLDVDGPELASTGVATHSVVGGSLFCDCKAGEFVRTMQETVVQLHTEQPLDCVIIETSGMANPSAIGTLMDQHGLKRWFGIRSVVTVVAANRMQSLILHLPVARQQVEVCDQIVLNKVDTVTEAELEAAETTLRAINQKAEIIRAQFCQFPFSLDEIKRTLPAMPLATCDANPFTSVTVQWSSMLSVIQARNWLQSLPAAVVRAKGWIDTPQGTFKVQKTLDSLDVQPDDENKPTGLVLIVHDKDESLLNEVIAAMPGRTFRLPT
ncbi:MAG: GTP-binding protein [Verrucomicrobia bacterium]|nr:GTP-binding protein [Verrucomicrobiota bacterium]